MLVIEDSDTYLRLKLLESLEYLSSSGAGKRITLFLPKHGNGAPVNMLITNNVPFYTSDDRHHRVNDHEKDMEGKEEGATGGEQNAKDERKVYD